MATLFGWMRDQLKKAGNFLWRRSAEGAKATHEYRVLAIRRMRGMTNGIYAGGPSALVRHPAYCTLEPHMAEDTRAAIQAWLDESVPMNATRDHVEALMNRDIAALEQKWNLL